MLDDESWCSRGSSFRRKTRISRKSLKPFGFRLRTLMLIVALVAVLITYGASLPVPLRRERFYAVPTGNSLAGRRLFFQSWELWLSSGRVTASGLGYK
jgi:hypothetical protein